MKLYQLAFLQAQKEFKAPIKDKANPGFKGSRYASLESILNAVQPALNKYGITISMPMRGNTVYVIFTHAESGEFADSWSEILLDEKDKTNEQKRGSAITYQRRRNLEGLAGVTATDDDDANAASETTATDDYMDKWGAVKEVAVKTGVHSKIKPYEEDYRQYFMRNYKTINTNDVANIAKFLADFIVSKDKP